MGAFGCSAGAEGSDTGNTADELRGGTIYGTHRTCWHEDQGDEGPIAYRSITLNKDGTFQATIEQDDPRSQAAEDWVKQHPDATVSGKWERSSETTQSQSGSKPLKIDYITFTEDGAVKWIYDLEDTEQAHTFKLSFKTDKHGAFYLGWDNAYYVDPQYVPQGAKCKNTNING